MRKSSDKTQPTVTGKLVLPKPFLKWAGGKRQLLPELIKRTPKEFNDYFEPFVGGGALFFELFAQKKIGHAYLNDINQELITAYTVVKDYPKELIAELKEPKYSTDEENYYRIRAEQPNDPIKASARLFYLNRTAFNGLYRVNKKGLFNVPYGRYKNPRILDEANILSVSEALQTDELTTFDFEQAISSAKEKDFIYFDPPYQPLSITSNFTSYTKENFGKKDQERLANTFKKLSDKGCYVMLSNSYNEWVVSLYSDFNTQTVQASRMINCKATGRGKIAELIVTNY